MVSVPSSIFDRYVLIAVEERFGNHGECQLSFQLICVQVANSVFLYSKSFVNILAHCCCDSQAVYCIYTEVSISACVPTLRNPQGSSGWGMSHHAG